MKNGRKWMLVGFILLFALGQSHAAEVGGDIVNEVWDQSMSPVRVIDHLTVASLTIMPGVDVEFTGDFSVTVNGVLRILGSEEAPVNLQPAADNSAGGWRGIYFEDTQPGSTFQWCHIQGALASAVHVVRSHPTFQHCTFTANSGSYGGAIRAELNDGDLIVDDCEFEGNSADTAGGAIWATVGTGTLVVSNSIFDKNIANPNYEKRDTSGGAVFVAGNATFLKTRFTENQTRAYTIYAYYGVYSRGGALWTQNGHTTVTACEFRSNAALMAAHSQTPDPSYLFGGAVYMGSGTLILQNSLVVKNWVSGGRHPSYRGSALYVGTGNCTIENSTFAENTSDAAIYNESGVVDILNSILFQNNNDGTQIRGAATVSYSDIQGGYDGEGNIQFNPVFDGNYTIIFPDSPAIDAGHPDPAYYDTLPPGQGTVRNDMGYTGGPNAHYWNEQPSPPVPLCHGLKATIIGTDRADIIYGTDGDDVIYGGGGNDVIYGGGGNDVICGGDGDDIIMGGAGNDRLFGDKGNDVLLGQGGNDKLYGGQGNDILDGGPGRDRLFGGSGIDLCDGGSGTDTSTNCEATVNIP